MYTYPKNFLSITQLIQKLKDTGMTIDSNDTAEIAYYRLKGYSFHLIDPSTKKYIEGTSLSNILRLYRFDSELSDLLFSYLSQIEVALKSQLVNAFQITHDALVLNDPSVFKDKKTFWKNQSTIASEISRSNDVFIEHNFDNHDGAIPIWAAVEVMSFGTISKTIKNMKEYIAALKTDVSSIDRKVAEKKSFIEDCKAKLIPLFDELKNFYAKQGIKVIKRG